MTIRTLLLSAGLVATSATHAEIGCTKIGFEPGTPDPNYCFTIAEPAPDAPTQPTAASAPKQAKAYADAGDARTLQQAQAHADAGDARTLEAARQHTTVQVAALQKEAFAGIAQAAALAPLAPAADGETTLNLGGATYGGQSALGVALAHQLGRMTLNAGVGKAGGQRTLVRVGLGWRF